MSTPSVPYYEDEWVTLYYADCRDFEPSVHHVLVTDPPYGIDLGNHGAAKDGRSHLLVKNGYDSYLDSYENYMAIVIPVIRDFIAYSKRSAVWVGPHYHELPKADAIGGIFNPAASGRNRWGFKNFLPVFLYGIRPDAGAGCFPTSIMSTKLADKNGHPTPKPLSWMRWLVGLVSLHGETIIDPFAGSGTTLRAAKDMGRKAIGIEIDETYCEIAARICSQEVLNDPGEPIFGRSPVTSGLTYQEHLEWLRVERESPFPQPPLETVEKGLGRDREIPGKP